MADAGFGSNLHLVANTVFQQFGAIAA